MFKLLLPLLGLIALVLTIAVLASGSRPSQDDTPAPMNKGHAVVVTLTMAATLFFAYLFGKDIEPIAWALKNPLITVPVYLAIGLFWMFAEWIGRGMSRAATLRDKRVAFFATHKLGSDITRPVPDHLRADWRAYAGDALHRRDPAHYKGELVLWFGCWPVYAAYALGRFGWFLVHAPITYVARGVYRFFGRWLRAIADWQSRTYDNDK
jgi:hypothetical protein